jgi:hypothetical protein
MGFCWLSGSLLSVLQVLQMGIFGPSRSNPTQQRARAAVILAILRNGAHVLKQYIYIVPHNGAHVLHQYNATPQRACAAPILNYATTFTCCTNIKLRNSVHLLHQY